MLAKLRCLFTQLMSFKWWALLFLAFLYFLSAYRIEKLQHEATRQELERWKTAAQTYELDVQAQAENARQCLEREAQAREDAATRAAIVQAARPRVRSTDEKNKVVDDATRSRVVERINRPL